MDTVLLLKAAIMGVVEGLSEFLPISSTGHLILAGSLLGMSDEKAKVFDIAIQTGAIFAVILVYWQKIRATLAGLAHERPAQRFAANVLIGFAPAVVLGLLAGAAKTVTPDELNRFIILAEGMKGFNVTDDLSKIACPVLAIGSSDDGVLGADATNQIAKHLKDRPDFQMYMYNGYGHAAYDTAPDYKERLLRFFAPESAE